jgi:hypothetical protein
MKEQRVVFALFRIRAGRHHKVGCRLLDGDAKRADFSGQAGHRLVDAVLHINGRNVGIARRVEGDHDLARAAVGARGGHVEHPLDAVDGLLERCGHRGFDGLGVRAGVDRRHADRRRRHLRILRDWHLRNREHSRQDDDQ